MGPWEPPDDLILQLRLAALRKNLEQVQGTSASVSDRLREVIELAGHISQTGVSRNVYGLRRLVTRLKEDFEDFQAGRSELTAEFGENLGRAVERVATIETVVNNAAKTVDRIQARWGPITEADAALSDLQERMDSIFGLQAGQLIDKINKLEAAPPKGGGFHEEISKEAIDAAWAKYGEVGPEGEELFSEYVDFLGGFALRNTGFDNDVSRMADDLIERWSKIGEETFWHSLAVPARRERTVRTLARMIRLGFPEWTIWAVPLSAYEFGRVVLRSSDSMARYVSGLSAQTDSEEVETCLADAFATYAMGPAYAYASVLLRFEPKPDPGSAPDHRGERPCADNRRAFVVFKMLDRMDESDRLYGVTQQLKRLWTNALEQAGSASDLGAAEEVLDGWVQKMWDFLTAKALPTLQYKAKRWQDVTSWGKGDLLQLKKENFNLSTKGDIRDVLNLAWWQRMRNPVVSEEQLAGAAVQLWHTAKLPPGGDTAVGKVE